MDFYAWLKTTRTTVAADKFPDKIPNGMEALPKDQCSKWEHPDDWKKDPLVKEVKEHFGCRDDYFPTQTYRDVVDDMANEYTFASPTDTADREKEVAAVMLLVKSGRKEDLELAREFADVLMQKKDVKHGKKELLKKMQDTFFRLLGREEGGAADKGYLPKVAIPENDPPKQGDGAKGK